MRIDFSKQIGGSELKPYLSERPASDQGLGWYVIAMNYDLRGIERNLIGEIEQDLERYEILRTAPNILWVASPGNFSLRLDATIKGWHDSHTSRHFIGKDELEPRGYKDKKTLLGYTSVPLFREIPTSVDVTGKVAYEAFENPDPTPVLKILRRRGYTSEVITTPEEVEEVLERSRAVRA